MSLDVTALREHFPSLRSGIAHFDSPGGTQTPREVGVAIAELLTGPLSNRGRSVASEINADEAVTRFRGAFADFMGLAPEGVVYGRSATQLIYDISRALAKDWGPGDEVVVSRLDHDANVRPWIQAARATGAAIRWIDFDPATAELDPASLHTAITERTRLVAVTAASNLLGTKPDLPTIAAAAHAAGALVHVDGVHFAAHGFVDVPALGADIFVCSPYKFFGPHCGVLGADPALLQGIQPDKLLPSTDAVPERFELGTLPYEVLAGAAAAVDFIARIGVGDGIDRRSRLRLAMEAIDEHELRLRSTLETALAGFGPLVTVHSRSVRRTPTLLATLPGRRCADAARFLAERGILAPAGSFYAYEPFTRLGLSDDAALRIGLAPYTNDEDVARLVHGLQDFLSDSGSGDPVTFWEARYSSAEAVWSGRPNQVLVDVASGFEPGRALDLGCGEGADVIWLAEQGWQAAGIDVSTTAIERARKAAGALSPASGSADFTTVDLADWQPTGDRLDLVTASFLHSPVTLDRSEVLRRAAHLIAPGGHLLIVTHAAPPPWAAALHQHAMRFPTPDEEIAALDLDPEEWRTAIAEVRTRAATGPGGEQASLDDVVVLLERRRTQST